MTINLTFHGLGPVDRRLDAGEDAVWLDSATFATVLDAVAERDDVAISFDDGNASDVTVALPALRERRMSATFFVVAGRVGQPHFLSAEDVRLLQAEGMTIGSHGMRHRCWRKLDDAALDEELGDARRLLEEIVGQPVTQASIPFGEYDRQVLSALRRHGYDRVFTSDGGPASAAQWLQARTSLGPGTGPGELAAILSPQASPTRQAAGQIKRLVKQWR